MMIFKMILIKIYYSFIYYIPGIFREILLRENTHNSLPVISFLDTRWGKLKRQNWGDDMNCYLCNLWFHKRLINYSSSVLSWLFKRTNYAFIGSILQSANKRTIVWGSGLHDEKEVPKEIPKKIYAVRGPLSRKRLIESGISCPDVYGDPILLLSKFYNPVCKTKYRLGIIPHMNDEANPLLGDYLEKHSEVCLISMHNYQDWKEIVNMVCSCEMVISSSLHGLILSDTYNVPNVWVEFSDKVHGKGFKFRDYFASTKRQIELPIRISTQSDFDKAIDEMVNYKPININLQPLIDSCPFPLPFK